MRRVQDTLAHAPALLDQLLEEALVVRALGHVAPDDEAAADVAPWSMARCSAATVDDHSARVCRAARAVLAHGDPRHRRQVTADANKLTQDAVYGSPHADGAIDVT